MRSFFPTLALVAALLLAGAQLRAQQQAQPPVPDAPQAQKKTAPKPATPAEPDTPPAKQDDNQNDNAFPEAVSRDAAKTAQQENSTPSPAMPGTQAPPSGDNPFPEDVSRDAAKEAAKTAGKEETPTTVPKSDLPPGVSSSQAQDTVTEPENGPQVADPPRAQKDTDVGGFYLKTGNFQGALMRFQDASKADPTNVAAIFGMAQAQQSLGKTAQAAENYQLYLDIVPNGPRAKEAMKALKTLHAKP